jgi:uncharacterized OB-fold protein
VATARSGRPVPEPTGDTAYFWERCRAGQLVLQRCAACGRVQFYPRALCTGCLSATLEWIPASGRGAVHSFTTVFRAPTPDFQGDTPYVVAVIELAEGVRLISRVTGCAPAQVAIGMPVEVVFEAVSEAIALPWFRPADPARARSGG